MMPLSDLVGSDLKQKKHTPTWMNLQVEINKVQRNKDAQFQN